MCPKQLTMFEPKPSTPEDEAENTTIKETVRSYIAALQSDNKAEALNLLSSEDRQEFSDGWDEDVEAEEELFGKNSLVGPIEVQTVGSLTVDDNSRQYAQVKVVLTAEKSGERERTYELVKEDGWKIYFGSGLIGTWFTRSQTPGEVRIQTSNSATTGR